MALIVAEAIDKNQFKSVLLFACTCAFEIGWCGYTQSQNVWVL